LLHCFLDGFEQYRVPREIGHQEPWFHLQYAVYFEANVNNQLQSSGKALSRRKFIAQSSAAAVGVSIVPRRILGGPRYVAPSEKINMAFIGVGAQGFRVMLHFLGQPDVQAVAVCDVTQSAANYPQWDTQEFCKSVRKLLGVNSGWDWLSPDQPLQLIHALRVTSGVAGREPAQKVVNGYYAAQQRSVCVGRRYFRFRSRSQFHR